MTWILWNCKKLWRSSDILQGVIIVGGALTVIPVIVVVLFKWWMFVLDLAP